MQAPFRWGDDKYERKKTARFFFFFFFFGFTPRNSMQMFEPVSNGGHVIRNYSNCSRINNKENV